MFIYKITNKINGKVYIGQTIQKINERFYRHVYEATVKKSPGALYNAIRKYNPSSFFIEEIDGANSETELNYKEFIHIHKNNSLAPIGYNLKEGGKFAKLSKESRKKISISIKKISTNQKMSELTQMSKLKTCKPIMVENIQTGIVIELPSLESIKTLGGSSKYLSEMLSNKRRYKEYLGSWIWYKGSDKPTPGENEVNIKWKITNIKTNITLMFDSTVECEKYLKVSRKTICKYEKNNKVLQGVYVLKKQVPGKTRKKQQTFANQTGT